jgi:hypothetical protein
LYNDDAYSVEKLPVLFPNKTVEASVKKSWLLSEATLGI